MGLAFLGDKLSAEQAAQWGLIWRCVEDAEFSGVVDALARQLAAAPTQGLARTKQAIYESWGRSLEQQLDAERDAQRELGRTRTTPKGLPRLPKSGRRSLPAARLWLSRGCQALPVFMSEEQQSSPAQELAEKSGAGTVRERHDFAGASASAFCTSGRVTHGSPWSFAAIW